jgi:hypothetical protein
MTDMAKSDRRWTGETSLVDQAMLSKQSVNNADIHAEEFSGY